jgi:hypothetical protein
MSNENTAPAPAPAPRCNASGPPEPVHLGQPPSPGRVNQNDVLDPPRAPGRPFGDNTAPGNRAGSPIPFVLPEENPAPTYDDVEELRKDDKLRQHQE